MPLAAIELNPHPFFYLLLILLPIAALFIIFLYFKQIRLASKPVVIALTAIRLLLLLLIAILFLRPATQWTYNRTSSGTLWFLIDQSPSMQAADQQATPIERVHWAEALGQVPQTLRTPKLDLRVAELTALHSAFHALQPPALEPSSAKQLSEVAEFLRQFSAWIQRIETIKRRLDNERSLASPSGQSVKSALEHVLTWASSDAQAAKSAVTLRAAADAIHWQEISNVLEQARDHLAAASRQADADFLARKASDIPSSIGRLAGTPRGQLAAEFLSTHIAGKNPDRIDAQEKFSEILARYRLRIATFSGSDRGSASASLDPDNFSDLLQAALVPPAMDNAPQSTNISSGLQLIAEQIALDEPAAIIIVSDGRHNTPVDPTEPARLLARRGIRVFGLLAGSHAVAPDAAIDQVDAPEWIFRGDTLRATAYVRLDGLASSGLKTAKIELRRNTGNTSTVIQSLSIPITPRPGTASTVTPVDFNDQPPEGQAVHEYEARVEQLPGEVNLENNRSTFRVAVKKDKLLALLIEDRPRWEYRYLGDHLARDPRIKLQKILLDPALIEDVAAPAPVKASPDNPRIDAQLFPDSAAEWQAFDLIILGDIAPDKLPPAQQQFIAAAVRDKGATLITIAGNRNMPARFADSPLAELLPITLAPQFDDAAIIRHTRLGFRTAVAPEGATSVLSNLGLTVDSNSALWSNAPEWYWHSPYTQVKPAASAIWSIADDAAPGPHPAPPAGAAGSLTRSRNTALVSTLSIGLGKTMHLASDQTWRLRQVNGNNIHERFWNNVLGWAVGSDLPAGGKFVRFGASQPRYAEGQPVEITARVLQENLVPYSNLSFSAVAKPIRGATPAASTSEAAFHETETPGYYRATLTGLPPGDVEISLKGETVERLLDTDPSVTQKTLLIKILPQLNLERRNMNTDPPLLSRIATAGGGFALDVSYADVLAANLPDVKRTHTITEHIGFFTDPAARGTKIAHWSFLALFTLLLAAEWLLRKRTGLI